MNDEQLDEAVRDADPCRPDTLRHLDGAKQTLLEEIMSELPPDRVVTPLRRRPALGRIAGAVAAAAAVTAILVGGSTMLRGHDAPPTTADGGGFSAGALQAAEKSPRLLIDEPGWKAVTVYGFAKKDGTISFQKDTLQLEMNWYAADDYGSYHRDRLEVSKPEAVKVDGWPADVFTYSSSDFAVMLRPRDGSFVEMRTGSATTANKWTRAKFDTTVSHVKRVDAATFLAALPPEIVTPDKVDDAAQKVLADVPLPPGFNSDELADLGVNDQYQFGAEVTSKIGCGWIREWDRARKAGDHAAAKKAADAMAGSHQWKVLNDMNAAGDWPEVFWELSDKLAAGQEPQGYESAIGCE